jgi:hypothetical protein
MIDVNLLSMIDFGAVLLSGGICAIVLCCAHNLEIKMKIRLHNLQLIHNISITPLFRPEFQSLLLSLEHQIHHKPPQMGCLFYLGDPIACWWIPDRELLYRYTPGRHTRFLNLVPKISITGWMIHAMTQ